MLTEYCGPFCNKKLQEVELGRIIHFLQQGEVVAFPTETVYGIGGSILHENAIRQIFSIKKRKADHPIPVQIAHLEQIAFLAKDVPPLFYRLAAHFLPGPLTIILKKNPKISPLLTGGKETIAIRFSSNPIATRIIEIMGCPLVVSSANLSNEPNSTNVHHLMKDLNGFIRAVVDGGETAIGIESTVLSLENPKCPLVLRWGAITKRELEKVVPVKVDPRAILPKKFLNYPSIRLFSLWEEIRLYQQMSVDCKRCIMSFSGPPPFPLRGEQLQLKENHFYEGLHFAHQNSCKEVLVLCDEIVKKNEALLHLLKQVAVA